MIYSCKCWTCVILCIQKFDIANVSVSWVEQKEMSEKIIKTKILEIYSTTEPSFINEVCWKCLLFMPSTVTETFSWLNFPYLFFCLHTHAIFCSLQQQCTVNARPYSEFHCRRYSSKKVGYVCLPPIKPCQDQTLIF